MVNGCKGQDRTANMNLTYAYIIGLALPDRRQSLRGCVTWLGDSRVITWGNQSRSAPGFPHCSVLACVCITFPAGMMLLRCTPETVPAAGSREGDEDPFIMVVYLKTPCQSFPKENMSDEQQARSTHAAVDPYFTSRIHHHTTHVMGADSSKGQRNGLRASVYPKR